MELLQCVGSWCLQLLVLGMHHTLCKLPYWLTNNRQRSQPPTGAFCAGVRNNLLCCQGFLHMIISLWISRHTATAPARNNVGCCCSWPRALLTTQSYHFVFPVLANAGRLHADACMAGWIQAFSQARTGLGLGALQSFDQIRIGSRVPHICITSSFRFRNPGGMFASALATGSTSSVVQCIL